MCSSRQHGPLDLGAPGTRHWQQSRLAGDDEAAKDPGAGGLEQAPEVGRAEVASSAGVRRRGHSWRARERGGLG
jgi:hypothetical protein